MPADYATQIPGENLKKREKKTPLLQPANDFIASVQLKQNIELPQARCSSRPLWPRLPVAAEGRFTSYFANSSKE